MGDPRIRKGISAIAEMMNTESHIEMDELEERRDEARPMSAQPESEDIRPEYYGEDDPYEPWKIIRAKKMDFFQGNALKYLMRAGVKHKSTREEDCDKAITYLKEWRDNGNSHE